MSNFRIQSDGTYIREIQINTKKYKLIVPKEVWETHNVSRHTTYWINRQKNGKKCAFKYGIVDVCDDIGLREGSQCIQSKNCNICSECNKEYKTRGGYLKHIKKYHSLPESIEIKDPVSESAQIDNSTTNTRIEVPTTQIDNSTTTNTHIQAPTTNNITNNIQLNIPIRNYSDENPEWLTSDIIMRAIRDIPNAIPTLIQEKHFNDKFPENKNVRLENKRSIRKRLKIFDDGIWRLKDRDGVQLGLVDQAYIILESFIDMILEETEDEIDDESSPIDQRIAHITKRIRRSEMRSARVKRMLRNWEKYRNNLESEYEKTTESFKDKIDTFLLDNELILEQLREKKGNLMK
jgi:hypothetical protein